MKLFFINQKEGGKSFYFTMPVFVGSERQSLREERNNNKQSKAARRQISYLHNICIVRLARGIEYKIPLQYLESEVHSATTRSTKKLFSRIKKRSLRVELLYTCILFFFRCVDDLFIFNIRASDKYKMNLLLGLELVCHIRMSVSRNK